MTDRRYRCSACGVISADKALRRVPHEWGENQTVPVCPHCGGPKLAWLHLLCDEPGCDDIQGIGTPTVAGYRLTCHKHAPKERT